MIETAIHGLRVDPPLEDRLILGCLSPNGSAPPDPSSLEHDSWQSFLKRVRLHAVAPPVYECFRSKGLLDQLPEDVRNGLRTAWQGNIARNIKLFDDLRQVLEEFHRKGIRAVVLKGAALAHTVYPNAGQRVIDDIDLLVRKEDLQEAAQVIHRLKGRGISFFSFETEADHHDLTLEGLVPFDFEELWARAEPIELDGAPALIVAPEEAVLTTALSCFRRHFYHFRYLYDLKLILERHADTITWEQVIEHAEKREISRALRLTLALATELMHVSVPEKALEEGRPGRLRQRCINWLLSHEMALEKKGALLYVAKSPSSLILQTLVGSLRYTVRESFRIFIPTTQWMKQHYGKRTHKKLYPLFYLIHPFLVIYIILRSAVGTLKKRRA